jgi:hypothetical protein
LDGDPVGVVIEMGRGEEDEVLEFTERGRRRH